MFKFIFTGLLVYFVYRFFIAPPVIDREGSNEDNFNTNNRSQNNSSKSNFDDDYIDYEEVD